MAMTIEQERAMAMARARQRQAQQQPAQVGAGGSPPSPQQQQPKGDKWSALGSAATGAVSGITFGFDDEIAAGLNTGFGFAGDYGQELERQRGMQREAQEAHPYAHMGGEISGALVPGVGAIKAGATLVPRVAKMAMPARMTAGAAEGAAWGAAHGLGRGEGDDRLASAARGAGAGAVVGGGIPAVAAGIGAGARKVMQGHARKTIPSADALTRQANTLYEAAKKSGVTLTPQTSTRMAAELKTTLDDAAFHPRIHPKVAAAFDEIVSDAGKPLSLQRVDQLRRIVGSAAKSNEADERRVASMLIEKLDEVVDGLTPNDVTGSGPATATALFKQARGLWARKRKDEMIADAVERAVRRAESTGSGGNADNAIRQNIRAILDNPKKVRGFSKEERALMAHIVKGGKGQNLLRLVGKLSPQGSGLMAALGLGATVANPLMAAAPAAGLMAKSVADKMTPRNVSRLSDTIRSGGQLPQGRQLTAQERQFLQAVLTGTIQQGHRAEPLLAPVFPYGAR